MSNGGYAAVLAMVALLVAIVFGVTYPHIFPNTSTIETTSSTSSSTSPTNSSSSTNNLQVYTIVYSGSASSSDSSNPIPYVPDEQCSADYPCSNALNDSAGWTWSYVYYYFVQSGVGVYVSAYDMEHSTETATFSANWVAIPALGDSAASCANSTSVISNSYYYDLSTGAVLAAVQGSNGQPMGNSTQYAPWNAIGFSCAITPPNTSDGETAPALSACAFSYSDIFSFPIFPGTYPQEGSETCPSSDENGAVGGYAGGMISWSGSVVVSQGSCNDIPASTQMLSLLKACLAGALP